MKIAISLLLLTLNLSTIYSQEYYKTGNRIFTEESIANYMLSLQLALDDNFPASGIKVFYSILSTEHKADSTIHHIKITNQEISNEDFEPIYKQIGNSFPEFQLEGLDGKTYTMEDFTGKVVHLNFWFAGCKPCIEEMPDLNKLKSKYKEDVWFISITNDGKEILEKFLSRHEFNFTHLYNGKVFAKSIGNYTYPKNILLDKSGTIKLVMASILAKQPDLFEKELLKLIQE